MSQADAQAPTDRGGRPGAGWARFEAASRAARQAWWRLHERADEARLGLRLAGLEWRNRVSRSPLLGDAPVAVSLTSHGARIDTVHLTIESIGLAATRPRRLVLWLDEPARFERLPAALQRLRRRGLSVELCDGFGPHTKYFPYVQRHADDGLPLVTADDDLLYPEAWLQGLVDAHVRQPDAIHCYRARTMLFDESGPRPYAEWPLVQTGRCGPANFLTGVSGVIYPVPFLHALRDAGTGFMGLCPKADDVWLNRMALRAGFRVWQLQDRAVEFPAIPDTQSVALWPLNQFAGGNDRQILATYTPEELAALRGAAASGGD